MNKEDVEKLKKKTDKVIKAALQEQVITYNWESNNKVSVPIFIDGTGKLIPEYKTLGASGMDVRAKITEVLTLKPLERALVKTGVHLDIPEGYEIQLRPRSGLAYKKGLTLLNCIGTIDEDYIGEIGAILVNLSNEPQTIEPNERIAQIVLMKVEKMELEHVDSTENFNAKDRIGGYGSTGNQ